MKKKEISKRKLIDTAFIYAIAGLLAGVFHREFTKYMAFTGVTRLGKVHTHLFALGMIMFLIVTAFALITDLTKSEYFKRFYDYYNFGLIITASMLFARGVYEVLAISNNLVDAIISWTAGAGHASITIGIAFLFLSLKQVIKD
ncbi:MAG: DUF2871 domain-containing protein [Fenollaria massiliensis]|uniref:DUF2871 domain-containing protein n=1 Tax=Fenollaria massiliensis TaxID=938288 RepID=UPI000375424F|nr:DUF2871 domain-containing protein [Fenollaria massiliensis]OFK80386.1 hypothetical protein HMPREF2800_03070 [Anaerosphaera sp. HMSC064C01]